MSTNNDKKVADIPANFPRDATLGAVSGAQPKVLIRKIGLNYFGGLTNDELRLRFDVCSDLVEQLIPYAERKQSEQPSCTTAVILRRIGRGIEAKKWGQSHNEIDWIVQTLAERLGWPVLSDSIFS
jgi:hypothetical protein